MNATSTDQRILDISSRIDDAGQIEIAIADTGTGIGDDTASQLFTPFFSTKPTGMGLGLNICRSLIELHQGRLWFTSNTGHGCTFHIALPPARAADLPTSSLDVEESVSS
jgi:signal transduction histidine kinase